MRIRCRHRFAQKVVKVDEMWYNVGEANLVLSLQAECGMDFVTITKKGEGTV